MDNTKKFKIQIIDEYPESTTGDIETYSEGLFAETYKLEKVLRPSGYYSMRLMIDGNIAIENCNRVRILVDGIEIYSSKRDYEFIRELNEVYAKWLVE